MNFSAGRISPGTSREHRLIGIGMAWCAILLLADQWSKIVVESRFRLHESLPVVAGYFDFTYALNRGAAWSILEGCGWLLLSIAAAVFIAAILFLRQLTDGWPERYFAIFTVFSGILGNSIDRIWRGAVVDFISVHYREIYHYPIFNIADCAICIGIGIFLLSSHLRPEHRSARKMKGDL